MTLTRGESGARRSAIGARAPLGLKEFEADLGQRAPADPTADFHCPMLSVMIFAEAMAAWLTCA